MAKIKHLIWVKREAKYFCKRGWTHTPRNTKRERKPHVIEAAALASDARQISEQQICATIVPSIRRGTTLFDGDGLQLAGIGDAFGGGCDDAPQRIAKAVVGPDAITSCHRNDVLLG
jgi:hypothetical protein